MTYSLGVTPGLDPDALRRANILAAAVRLNGTVMAEIECDRWAEEFTRIADRLPASRIDAVLVWYCKQLERSKSSRPPGLPVAFSARTFKQRFEEIEESMLLNDDGSDYGPEVGGICRRLRCASWPGETALQLPSAVNMTIQRYRAWLPMRDAAIEHVKEGEDKDLKQFARHLQQYTMPPLLFTEVWWEEVWQDIHRRQGTTSLTSEVFQWPCRRFFAWGYRWAQEYCGRTDLWLLFSRCIGE